MIDPIVFNTRNADGSRSHACLDRSEVVAFETVDLCGNTIHQLRVVMRHGSVVNYRFDSDADRIAVARSIRDSEQTDNQKDS